jgi:hypothetical protein
MNTFSFPPYLILFLSSKIIKSKKLRTYQHTCYHASLNDLKESRGSVVPTSRIPVAPMFWVVPVIKSNGFWGASHLHNPHTNASESRSTA